MTTEADVERAIRLNAERQRLRMKLYQLGALVSLEPGRLGRMLNGKIRLPDPLAKRIAEVLERADTR